MSSSVRTIPAAGRLGLLAITAACATLLSGCLATAPTMGENKGTVSGAAGGSTAENNNSQLEKCTETLGTLAIDEDTNAPWYITLREYQLGSTVPVLRLMVERSIMAHLLPEAVRLDRLAGLVRRKLLHAGTRPGQEIVIRSAHSTALG